jgi:hypothetical protein
VTDRAPLRQPLQLPPSWRPVEWRRAALAAGPVHSIQAVRGVHWLMLIPSKAKCAYREKGKQGISRPPSLKWLPGMGETGHSKNKSYQAMDALGSSVHVCMHAQLSSTSGHNIDQQQHLGPAMKFRTDTCRRSSAAAARSAGGAAVEGGGTGGVGQGVPEAAGESLASVRARLRLTGCTADIGSSMRSKPSCGAGHIHC